MKHKHHIVPKHMGGTDDPENIIELSIEEHAEAHRLLWEQYGKKEDWLAWNGLLGLISKEEILKELAILSGRKGGAAGKGVTGNRAKSGRANWEKNREQVIKTLRANAKRNSELGLGGHEVDKWIWISNTEEEIKILKEDTIPDGWQRGRLEKSEETKEKIKKTMIKRGINKGIKRTKEHKQKLSKYRTGRTWYHNPKTNESSQFAKDDEIPTGWTKGRGKINMPKNVKKKLKGT